MKNTTKKAIATLRSQVADTVEEVAAVLMHLRESLTHSDTNADGARMDLADAGTVLMELHDTFGNLSKAAFDIKATLAK